MRERERERDTHTHTQTERHAETERNRQTDRQTGRQAGRRTDTQTDRQMAGRRKTKNEKEKWDEEEEGERTATEEAEDKKMKNTQKAMISARRINAFITAQRSNLINKITSSVALEYHILLPDVTGQPVQNYALCTLLTIAKYIKGTNSAFHSFFFFIALSKMHYHSFHRLIRREDR